MTGSLLSEPRRYTSSGPPDGDGGDEWRDQGPEGGWRSTPPLLVGVVGALLGAIVVILAVLVLTGGDDGTVETTDTSSTTAASSTTAPTEQTSTTEPAGSTTAAPSTTAPPPSTSSTSQAGTTTPPVDGTYLSAVWPWVGSETRYSDPVDAARGFAEDFVGLTDFVVGDFHQGDNRSGEVEITPMENGPTTVVFVRQLGPDDTWWVLGSATASITVDEPQNLSTVESPLAVTGSALAFEGHVNVVLRADGSMEPLATGYVTGGGDQVRPFEGTIEWGDTDARTGTLTLYTTSAEDGRVWEASVIRVIFDNSIWG